MKKELLPQTKIGEFLSIGVEMEKEEIGLYIASSERGNRFIHCFL